MATGGRRKSSILTDRKLSIDFARKLSAISVASDISLISDRFGLDQGELKNIVQDILEMNINDDFDVSINIIINWSERIVPAGKWGRNVWVRRLRGGRSFYLAGAAERDNQTGLQEVVFKLSGTYSF